MTDFYKYHGLGNDYIVMEPDVFKAPPSSEAVRALCDRRHGMGADGILLGPLWEEAGGGDRVMGLRIFNSDGSEGEKSGNGLRIFARHAWTRGHIKQRKFPINTAGGMVTAEVLDETGGRIAIEMGRVSFMSEDIPVLGPKREVLRESLRFGKKRFTISAATIGNPHCIAIVDNPSEKMTREFGPMIENCDIFPNRTNVQFMTIMDRNSIYIEIWERGSGYTLSSGSSSCAAAAVAVRLGHCVSPIQVHTQGGSLLVTLDDSFAVRMEGAVVSICEGSFSPDYLAELGLERR